MNAGWFDVEILLRALLLLGLLFVLWAWAARNLRCLTLGVRRAVAFALGMYILTFFAGAAWLFVAQARVVEAYFAGFLPAPDRTPYGLLLMLAALPLVVVPWAARSAAALLPSASDAADEPGSAPHSSWPVLTAAVVVVAAVFLFNQQLLPSLLDNALNGIWQSEGLASLYARREEAFAELGAAQAGLLYGSLPACAALLLFAGGQARWLARALGVMLLVAAVVLNIGLFQIGPLMAIGLMLVFASIVRRQAAVRISWLLAAALAAMLLFATYQSLKTPENGGANDAATQALLRVPIGLPFLWQFATEEPQALSRSDSVSHDLGEFMFPELRRVERFVSMVQPSFVVTFFQHGLLACLAVVVAIGVIAFAGGRALDAAHRSGDPLRPVMVAAVLSPALYYPFQTQLLDVLVSSYGVLWPALPVAVALLVQRLGVRPTHPAPASAAFER